MYSDPFFLKESHMSANVEVREVLIAEGLKLPERLREAQSPYIWALAAKKLLKQGRRRTLLKGERQAADAATGHFSHRATRSDGR